MFQLSWDRPVICASKGWVYVMSYVSTELRSPCDMCFERLSLRHVICFNSAEVARWVPTGSPSRGGDVAVYVFYINQPSLPTPFHSVRVTVSVFMALSTVFQSINSPDNSPLSHSVLPVLFLSYWSFWNIYLFMKVSFSPDIILCGWLGLKHQLTS